MLHNKRKFAALLAAAALCLAVPAASADYEPWTYEVDDVMRTYGVEYYSDVGFDMPQFDKKSSTSTQSAVTQPASGGKAVVISGEQAEEGTTTRANDSISVYSVGGINVYSAGNEYQGSDFTVTIPAEVNIQSEVDVDTTTNTASFPITGTLDKCYNLEIEIASANNYNLVCDGQNLPYKISDDKIVFWKAADATDTELQKYNVNIKVDGTPTMSGTYTDILTFTITPKAYTNDKEYTLTFDTNADDDSSIVISTEEKFVRYSEAYGMLPTPRRDYYDFAGWYTTATGNTKVDETTILDEEKDRTVYAHWTPHTVTINYHTDGAYRIQWSKDPGTVGATYKWKNENPTGQNTDSNKWIYLVEKDDTPITYDQIILVEIEVHGTSWSNGKNGLYDVWRWYKNNSHGYGTKWKLSESGVASVDDKYAFASAIEFLEKINNCPETMGILDDFKERDVKVDLYPVWSAAVSAVNESDTIQQKPDTVTGKNNPIALLPEVDETRPIVLDMPTADTDDTTDTQKADSTVPEDDIYDTVPAPWADDWYASDDYTGSDWTGDDLAPLLDWD